MNNAVKPSTGRSSPRWLRAVGELARSCRAATSPEYAIIIIAGIATLILAVDMLSRHTADAISGVNVGLHGPSVAADSSDRAVENNSAPIKPVGHLTALFHVPSAIVYALIGVLLAAAWVVVRRKYPQKKQQQPRSLEALPLEPQPQRVFEKRQQIRKILSNDAAAFLTGRLEVQHLMTRSPKAIPPTHSVHAACEIMDEEHFDHLLVCEDDGRLLGLVSKYYLLRTHAQTIADAMATEPLFVAPGALLNPTVTQMLNEGISCVAVVEGDRAIGILTTTDVQLALQAALHILAQAADSQPQFAAAH